MKRILELLLASVGLVLLSPFLVLIAILVKLDSPGPAIFRQQRVGKGFVPFTLYKFRTMVEGAPLKGIPITNRSDPRITRVGRVLRRTKLDELPQLINVLAGEMSFVGPRPEVSRYVAMFPEDYREILKVRPGLTDLASLKYRHEELVLERFADPEEGYLRCVLPDKIALSKQYITKASLRFDLVLLLKTLSSLFGREASLLPSGTPLPLNAYSEQSKSKRATL